MTSKVFLVGFMGSGKSTLGKLLAAELAYSFLDLDQQIEEKYNLSISAIFSKYGEQGFREYEKKVLQDLALTNHIIIATGGGTPCFYDNMDWMKSHGTVVFLNPDAKSLLQRLQLEQEHRPLISRMDHTELQKYIVQKLIERTPYYAKADLEVQGIEDSAQAVRWISQYLRSIDSIGESGQ